MNIKPLVLATALAPFAVQADNPLSLEIVTATGYPISLDKVLASAEIITAEEIENSMANDIAEILRFHAGIELGRNGGPGQVTSVFIRGTESDHTLLLLDGIPINSASVGSAAIQNINPQNIQRIEIVKGPQSVMWGSGAIGGVINIITRKTETNGLSTSGTIAGGSDNSLRANAHLGYKNTSMQADAGLSYTHTHGFPALSASKIDSGYDNITANLGLTMSAGTGQISARHWQAQGNTEYLDYFLNPLDQDFLNSSSSLSWDSMLANNWNTTLSASYIRDTIEQNQSDESVKTKRTKLSWKNKFNLSENDTLLLGADYTIEKVGIQGGWSPYSNDSDFWELYTQYDTWLGDSHQLNLGGRYLDHAETGSEFTWNLSYGFHFTDASRITASASTGFKVPTTNERYGFGGNPDLKPEESTSLELSIKHALNSKQNIALSVYQNDIDNLIQWALITPPFTGYNQNIAETRIKGAELSYDLNAGAWDLNLSSVWQDPKNRKSDSQLLRRARYNFNARLSYQWNDFTIGSSFLYAGKRKDFGNITLDHYSVLNLDANYRLNPDWSLYAKIENLFDEDYELASGYNAQGLAGFVGIRYR